MKNLLAKMLAVQKDMKPIEKTDDNPFFKSKYFSIDTVISELKPILNKHGLVVTQPLSLEGLTTQVSDPESGESMSWTTPLPQNPDPQKQGAIITYFRRYSLVSLFMLQGENDDDGNSASGQNMGFRPTGNAPKDKIIGTLLKLEPQDRKEAVDNLEKTGDWSAAEINALRTRPKV